MTMIELVSKNFLKIQIVIFIAGILVWIRHARTRQSHSHFRVREADRTDLNRLREGPGLANAKLARKSATPPVPPLSLPGIRLSGAPHEILGISEAASIAEIMKAYKESIKRFHPDTLQGQAKDQLEFYQQASATINQAKEDMLKQVRAKRS